MLTTVLLSMFIYTGTTMTFYECVTEQVLVNRDLRVIEAPNGYKIIVRGVRCYEV